VEVRPYRRHRFASTYTATGIALLAEVDRAHEWLSGPATVRILKREYEEFGKAGVCAPSADLPGAPVQPAERADLSQSVCGVYSDQTDRCEDCRAAQPGHGSALATCGWTLCIRGTGTGRRAYITSMP
jgi:hypothetical protein